MLTQQTKKGESKSLS